MLSPGRPAADHQVAPQRPHPGQAVGGGDLLACARGLGGEPPLADGRVDGLGHRHGVVVDPVRVVDGVRARPRQQGGHAARGGALGGRQVEGLVVAGGEHEAHPPQPGGHVRTEGVEHHPGGEALVALDPPVDALEVGALLRPVPDPPVLPRLLGLDRERVPRVHAPQLGEDVQAPVQPLARGRDADHAQGVLGPGELGAAELLVVHPVGDHDHLPGGPPGDLAGQVGVVGAHAHHRVDLVDVELAGPLRVELEAVQPHDEPLVGALPLGVEQRVGPAPLADHHVGPGGQLTGAVLVVGAQPLPLVHAHVEAGQRVQVLGQAGEELHVVPGDDHLERPLGVGAPGDGRQGVGEVAAQPLGGPLQRVVGRGGAAARGGVRVDRAVAVGSGHHVGDRGDVGPGEERVVGAQHGLVHGRAVEHHRQAERAQLQHLGGQLQAGVHGRVAPGQPEAALGGLAQRLGSRHPAAPVHVRGALQGPAHVLGPVGGFGVDLVADHHQFGVHPAPRQLGGQFGHLQGVPARRELAGVGQAGPAAVAALGPHLLGDDHHRREQDRPAAGGGHRRLQEGAQLLRLAEQEPRGQGDLGELGGGGGGQLPDTVREVGQVGPQAARQRLLLGGQPRQAAPAHDDEVEGLALVVPGHEGDGLLRGEPPRPQVGQRLVLVGPQQPDPGRPGERLGEPVGAHGRLQQQGHLASGGGQGLRHRLRPDRGTVDDVEVHVPVQECARRRCAHVLPFGCFLVARTAHPTAPVEASAASDTGSSASSPVPWSGPRARSRVPRRFHSAGSQARLSSVVRTSSGTTALTKTY